MQLSNPVEVFNLEDFLPLDGEDKFEMSYTGNILNLDIFYETENHALKRRIRFSHSSYFIKTPFPGHSFFNCPDHGHTPLLSSLVEYKYSELADLYQRATGLTGYRHYRLFLHSVGVAIEVVAKSCELLPEELID